MAVGYGMGHAIEIKLTEAEREELRSIVRRSSESAGLVRRARVVQLSDEAVSGREIALRLDLSPEHVSVIRSRFRAEGVPGLAERPKPGRTDHAVSAGTEARLVQLAMSPPPAGRSRWTARLLAKAVRLSAGCVSDVLRRNGLKPHLVHTYKVSRDPDFAAKMKDIVGLYLNPPEHAVVLSMDEKTQIQDAEAHLDGGALVTCWEADDDLATWRTHTRHRDMSGTSSAYLSGSRSGAC